jgi:putative hydrolase of the HAD superfamily
LQRLPLKQLLQQAVPELAPDEAAARQIATQVFESFTPDSDWALFDLGRVDEATLARRIAPRVGATPEQVRRIIDAIPPHLVAQTPVVDLVHRLKASGHRMYFLSNMPAPYADHLERHNPFIAAFDDGIYSGRVGLMKPGREIFQLATDRFRLEDAGTLFIDDHAGNVEAARLHGWQTLQFTGAEALRAALLAGAWLRD